MSKNLNICNKILFAHSSLFHTAVQCVTYRCYFRTAFEPMPRMWMCVRVYLRTEFMFVRLVDSICFALNFSLSSFHHFGRSNCLFAEYFLVSNLYVSMAFKMLPFARRIAVGRFRFCLFVFSLHFIGKITLWMAINCSMRCSCGRESMRWHASPSIHTHSAQDIL